MTTPGRQTKRIQTRPCNGAWRRGAAAVEAAIVLPVVVFVVFGSIELANGVFMKQSLAIAAYEGAREASRPGGTQAQAKSRIREVLSNKGVDNETVTFTPEITADTPRGTKIYVKVSAPVSTDSINPCKLLINRKLEQSVVMVRL
ncbi:MAG: pilus assembly protein [Pirellula sp.]|jgi:Flp pilus assembly protein TadG|nr:pilus assembly protein [Pirellula sp.]